MEARILSITDAAAETVGGLFPRQHAPGRVISPPEFFRNRPVATNAPDTAQDERDLIARARGGDLAAFDDLVRRTHERVYATLYHMTSSHEDANDLTQEAFIKAWQAIKSFKGDSSFFTWVYRIAVNRTINHLKTRRNRAHHLSLNDLDFNAENDPDLVKFVSENTPRREVALAELQRKLNEAMQKLSEEHRLVVTLHDVQGMPHEEIARIMDCNIGTVRSRLYYARQQLQGHLGDYLKAIR
jgi:RNA polymerase sigma-70 factor (ECF subfamily)